MGSSSTLDSDTFGSGAFVSGAGVGAGGRETGLGVLFGTGAGVGGAGSKRLAHVAPLVVVGGEVTLELSFFFSPALSASVIKTVSLTAGSSLKSFGCATPFGGGGPGRARLE